MKTKHQKILSNLHFTTLAIIIINSLINYLTGFGFEEYFKTFIKSITIISGLILFLFNLRPFKKKNFYYSIYAITTLLLVVGIIFRGIFGALLISIILFPIFPAEKEYEKENIKISTPFQGFMAPCCLYEISEIKFMIFEKDIGTFRSNGTIDLQTIQIKSTDSEIRLNFSTDYDENEEVVRKK